jgi:16S rRNA (uracil1498-N3)-methyltransferase
MSLSSFYAPYMDMSGASLTLDEATSKHCIQVLRMREGDSLLLTDGKGGKAEAVIRSAHKRYCEVLLTNAGHEPRTGPRVYIGISPIKNTSRFEWFLEKATEIGVEGIVPLICSRTERETFRKDRMINILVSAMLQSQQAWLPDLKDPAPLAGFLEAGSFNEGLLNSLPGGENLTRYIAHCIPGDKKPLGELVRFSPLSPGTVLLIGPEGDFTPAEVDEALAGGWIPVALGNTRLRTETAGIVAATLLRLG